MESTPVSIRRQTRAERNRDRQREYLGNILQNDYKLCLQMGLSPTFTPKCTTADAFANNDLWKAEKARYQSHETLYASILQSTFGHTRAMNIIEQAIYHRAIIDDIQSGNLDINPAVDAVILTEDGKITAQAEEFQDACETVEQLQNLEIKDQCSEHQSTVEIQTTVKVEIKSGKGLDVRVSKTAEKCFKVDFKEQKNNIDLVAPVLNDTMLTPVNIADVFPASVDVFHNRYHVSECYLSKAAHNEVSHDVGYHEYLKTLAIVQTCDCLKQYFVKPPNYELRFIGTSFNVSGENSIPVTLKYEDRCNLIRNYLYRQTDINSLIRIWIKLRMMDPFMQRPTIFDHWRFNEIPRNKFRGGGCAT